MRRKRAVDHYPLLEKWAGPLAEQFGCEPEDVLNRGMGAGNWQGTLSLSFFDGSQATFRYALCVATPDKKQVAVFTEHCGYFELSGLGLEIARIDDDGAATRLFRGPRSEARAATFRPRGLRERLRPAI